MKKALLKGLSCQDIESANARTIARSTFRSRCTSSRSIATAGLAVSEAAIREWSITAIDVKKAFLQGLSYQEIAAQTREPLREVHFDLDAQAAAVL